MAGVKEIAEATGVSIATVSRALRGLHHVNPETRSKVIEAAKVLNYPIDESVHDDLQDKSTGAIGIIAPYLSRWYFSQVVAGAEQALREAGLDLLVHNFWQSRGRERAFQQDHLKGRIDGLIVISLPPREEEFASILNIGVPVALVGNHSKECSSISIDDKAGARVATQHLINQGHQSIALMSGDQTNPLNFPVQQNRKDGFLEVLSENGIPWDEKLEVFGSFTMSQATQAMDELLARKVRPSAIFCISDEMAFGAMRSIQRHGLKIPEDISVVGFDDHEMASIMELTTIAQPAQMLGEMAAWSLMERLNIPEAAIKSLTLPTHLVVRASTKRLEN